MKSRTVTEADVPKMTALFRALAEPARLYLLIALCKGERTVTELVNETQMSQANVSKHLQLLYGLEVVSRRRKGLFVHYALADRRIIRLCELACRR